MKKIFIYYSYTGNGDKVAEFYQKNKYDIEKITTKEPLPKLKLLAIFIGGYKASINYKDKIEAIKKDINDYDEIVIGSPIWNSRLSSPINGLLSKYDFNNKNLTFILYSASGKPNKATNKLKELYPQSKIINLTEPKKYEKECKEILIKKG